MKNNLYITNETKGKLPSLPLSSLKDEILGKDFSLSLAYITPSQMKKINKTYRGKNKPTNILSFLLEKKEGEILLCPSLIKKQTKIFDRNFRELLGYLVIHGMLHLKGMEHSSKMEDTETKYDQKYFYRNRLGNNSHQSSGGRVHQRRKKS